MDIEEDDGNNLTKADIPFAYNDTDPGSLRKKKKSARASSRERDEKKDKLLEGEHSQSPLDKPLRPASAAQIKTNFRKKQILNRPAT